MILVIMIMIMFIIDDRPGIVRCGEHSDYGTVTILFQVRPRQVQL